MKAAVIREHGSLDAVEIADLPDPEAGPGEAVLDVKAAALNHLDIWVRKGRTGFDLDFPHVLGSDVAGVVAEVGEGVTEVAPGDEVIANPGLSCGGCEACRRGEQSECEAFGLVGVGRPGTFAEKVAVPAGNLRPVPEHLDWPHAAALTLTFTTAWRMLMSRAGLRPGEDVLIHGIGGGVALAGLQIAKAAGARVLVTSSSNEKLEDARLLGADATYNYTTDPGVVAWVEDYTEGRGVDVVLDAVGAATWPVDLQVLRRGGRVALCGVTTGAEAATNLHLVYWNQLSLLGSTMGSHEDVRQMLEAVATTQIAPVLDKTFPLAEAREAMARMEEGEQFGKIVLEVGD